MSKIYFNIIYKLYPIKYVKIRLVIIIMIASLIFHFGNERNSLEAQYALGPSGKKYIYINSDIDALYSLSLLNVIISIISYNYYPD